MRQLNRPRRRIIAVIFAAIVVCSAAFLLDAATQSWTQQHQSPSAVNAMRSVSRWGDWPSHVALGLVSAAIAYLCGSRRWCRIFVVMVIACAVAGSVARVVKIGAGRSRPTVKADAGWNGPKLGSKYNAFPSGHVAASAAFFAALAFATWRIGLWFLAVPALIAFSRMYVGAHHLSDVVCAAVLGLAAAWLVAKIGLVTSPDEQPATNS